MNPLGTTDILLMILATNGLHGIISCIAQSQGAEDLDGQHFYFFISAIAFLTTFGMLIGRNFTLSL